MRLRDGVYTLPCDAQDLGDLVDSNEVVVHTEDRTVDV